MTGRASIQAEEGSLPTKALLSNGQFLEFESAHAGDEEIIWHVVRFLPAGGLPGQAAKLTLNHERRVALSRYHTVLHILNTVALRDHAAWITGAQIGVDYARIDFKWEGFNPAVCNSLEIQVNSVIEENHPLTSCFLLTEEFAQRPELLRTLEVKPTVIGCRIRVVAIEGVDAQACGGTHVRTTSELGEFSITRTENKGKINKRLYVRLSPP